MSARRAMLEDIDFDLDAGQFVPARRGLVEPEDVATTAVLPKYEAQRAFAKPTANRAQRRNRALIGAGLAAVCALVPVVAPVHAEYAKAPKPAEITEYQDVTVMSVQSAAAADAAERAEQRRAAAAEAQRQAEEEAKRQAEEAERRAAEEARQRAEAEAEAQREREREQAAAASRSNTQRAEAAPVAQNPAQPQADIEMIVEVNGDAAGAIQYAMAQQGKPYQWGGTGPNGYDCSGLVYAAYRSIGITLPRTSNAMAGAGRPVASVADLQPGDIIISYGGGHAAMYIGNGMVVEALNYGIPVKTNPLPSGITAMRRVIG